ncbi:Uncharacterised protein [Bacillus paranthracis]|nr:Uncharacterised protein [Bacillus paranthracis]
MAPSKTLATGRNLSSSFIGFKPGELTIVGNTPTYPEFDLFPVAKAVAAGAESVIADSAEYVRTPPVTISSNASGFPLYKRANVVAEELVPSITIMITFFGCRSTFFTFAFTV